WLGAGGGAGRRTAGSLRCVPAPVAGCCGAAWCDAGAPLLPVRAGDGGGSAPTWAPIDGAPDGGTIRSGAFTGSGATSWSPTVPPPVWAACLDWLMNAPENNDGTSSRPSVAAAPATTHTARPGRRLAWACSGAPGGGSPDPPGPVPAAGGVSSAVNLVSFRQWQLSPPTRRATARSFTGVAILRRRPPTAGTGAPHPAAHGIRTGGPAFLLHPRGPPRPVSPATPRGEFPPPPP